MHFKTSLDMEPIKELDLGNSDFKCIIENNNYFVDKTLFIREIIKSQKQVVLLPRPRRFGKTLNLSMLKYFFEINHPENDKLFTGLKIWGSEPDVKEKRGKYPVIILSFKDAKKETWKGTYEHLVLEIANIYRQHSYLLKGDCLDEREQIKFNDILFKRASEVSYENSIKQLSEFLHRYYKQRVVILVDEYDTPIQAGYGKFYNEAISFIRGLLGAAFKDNSYLYKGVITGIIRVSKESFSSSLNNVSVYTILDNRFSDQFGFTEAETLGILSDFNIKTECEQVKNWYDGYKFGETEDIYNPWSILNYVQDPESGFKPFWVNTSTDDLIRLQIKDKNANRIREQFHQLINRQSIVKRVNENFVFPDLDQESELLWSLLLFSGYLTVDFKRSINEYALKIPNDEIRFIYKNIILDWLSIDVKIKQDLLTETTTHLMNNEISKFEKGFKEIMGDTFSYFDTSKQPENVYQSYVLGLLAILGDDYIIKSNRESGDGRYDIMLIPHDKKKAGIIIEIKQISKNRKEKVADFRKRIDAKIKEATQQIKENQYHKELMELKIENIIELPIVFAGKEPFISLINKE